MKFRLLLAIVAVAFLMTVLAVAISAQDTEVPPPYAELKNPFPWNDTSAQEEGKGLYRQSCLGCHGVKGSNVAGADFSAVESPQSLEESPDLYFWILAEGRLDKGMPPYKSSLSEEQRWQVLTYLWSLGKVAPPEVTPPTAAPPTAVEDGTMLLTVAEEAQAGQPLTLSATLRDSQGKPVGNATVKFFIWADFFTSGMVEIGESVTDDRGVAVLEYTPRQTGVMEVMARHEVIETTAAVNLHVTDEHFYHTQVGIQVPTLGEEVSIGFESHLELREGGAAPPTVFRLPTGVLVWLAPLLWTVMAIWVIYFYVIYQVFRIPIVSEIRDTDTRRVPLVGLAIVVALGILLVLMLVTGPLSNPHIAP